VIVLVWAIVGAVTVMRIIAAFTVPLTGDEAYYWEWSRHLAFGYTDHPPAVAWSIAAFSFFGTNPGVVRLPFVACGIIATLALAAAASRLSGDKNAGGVVALAFSLTPAMSLAFGSASPDGPYLAFWCVGMWLAVVAFDRPTPRNFAFLGIALGGVMLSRMTGAALLFGIAMYALMPQNRRFWKDGLWLSFAVAGLCFAPFVLWNAQHQWATFDFTFFTRHVNEGFSIRRVFETLGVQAAAYSPGIWLGVLFCALRPRSALVEWTAVPLFAILMVLAFIERVETNWFFGCYASMCVGLGVAWVHLTQRGRLVWANLSIVPALIMTPLLFYVALAPGPIYQAIRDTGSTLRNTGPFEIYTYKPLARDVSEIAQANDAIVMTDGYGLSSLLDFNAGISPVVIGYDAQGAESRRWYGSDEHPKRALFVDKASLEKMDGNPGRPDFKARLSEACTRVRPGPVLRYGYAGVPPRAYYLTWCDGLHLDGLQILRWETAAASSARSRG
jgi:hypothetical protein